MNLLEQARAATVEYRKNVDRNLREQQAEWEATQDKELLAQAQSLAQEIVATLCQQIAALGADTSVVKEVRAVDINVREILINILDWEGFSVRGDKYDNRIWIALPKGFHHTDNRFQIISQNHLRQCEADPSWPMY